MFENYPDVVGTSQLCEMLGLGKSTVYDLLHEGQINYVRVGRKYIIPKLAVIGFLKNSSYNSEQIIFGGLQSV